MKVAIVHYHLRRGGVTNVIKSARESLTAKGAEVLVISGEAPAEGAGLGPVKVIPRLEYRREAYLSVAEGLRAALKDAAQEHFGTQPDIWHFHNHSLGKNVLMPLVVTGLAEEKARILLQMHDFPEDGRPFNYVFQRNFFDSEKDFIRTLYPRASHVHYATINQRDRMFLKKAGMRADHVHLLPNAVSHIDVEQGPSDRPFARDKKFVLYPTRAIRRKNLGELVLMGLAYRDEFEFATTLVPENPEWKAVYDSWVDLARETELPIRFGIATDDTYRFTDLFGWSDAIITTSVAEGFGLAFLEPWLAGKSAVGRNLPRITADFVETGLDLGHMYDRLGVPIDWVDKAKLRREADNTLRRIHLAYDYPMPSNAVDMVFSRWVQDERIDFGMLNEEYQREILGKLISDPAMLEDLRVPSIAPLDAAAIEERRLIVESHYGNDTYGENLMGIYERLSRSSAGRVRHLDPRKVLTQFLDPWRLNLLRT